jgi:hypothetical protein
LETDRSRPQHSESHFAASTGLDASTMDRHDNLLRFRIVGRLFFDDLLPLVPQPPFAIRRAFEVLRVLVESGHRWIKSGPGGIL